MSTSAVILTISRYYQANDFIVKFNENGSSILNIKGKNLSSESLGIGKVSWNNIDDAYKSINEISKAIADIRNFTANLGNNYSILTTREDFTQKIINILEEGADKLILADMNEETANMLSLQTRQQLATNALSLSSQVSQTILKLF